MVDETPKKVRSVLRTVLTNCPLIGGGMPTRRKRHGRTTKPADRVVDCLLGFTIRRRESVFPDEGELERIACRGTVLL